MTKDDIWTASQIVYVHRDYACIKTVHTIEQGNGNLGISVTRTEILRMMKAGIKAFVSDKRVLTVSPAGRKTQGHLPVFHKTHSWVTL